MRVMLGVLCALTLMSVGFDARGAARTPTPPKGLEPCQSPYFMSKAPQWPIGEKIRYSLWVDGLAVGSVEFRVANEGLSGANQVYELVSRFKVDELVATVLPVSGEAHSIAEQGSLVPTRMWNNYQLNGKKYHESFEQPRSGSLIALRERQGSAKLRAEREFPGAIFDFVSGFYLLRSGRITSPSCALLFGSHRAFTVSLEPLGTEAVQTPIGQRPAEKLRLRYGAERSRKTREAILWISQSSDRLPYRVEIRGEHEIVVKIDMYDPGQIAILP